VKDPSRLMPLIEREKISRIVTAPSLLRAICEHDYKSSTSLRYWFVSGEALPTDLAKQAIAAFKDTQFLNLYGSTEVLSDVLYTEVDPLETASFIPLGKPISQVAVTVVDRQGSPVPNGVLGELVVVGKSVVGGYDGLEALTKTQFIDTPAGRGYRTGDLARVRPDGQIGYVGRADFQLKIRGYRIELGEIETRLMQVDWVSAAIVVAQGDEPENKHLVAYVSGDGSEQLIRDLRSALQTSLPDYMVPSFFMVLDALPLTPNGKINRKALPAPQGLVLADEYVAPANMVEAKHAKVWAAQLGIAVEQVSVIASFFELGGNSLLLLKLIGALAVEGIKATVKQFYELSSIRRLSQAQSDGAQDVVLETVVRLNQSEAEQPPLFVFHPLDGRVACYEGLAASMQDICPVVGIQAPFNYGCDWPFETIGELAAFYQKAVKRHQPTGPYRLAGWSAGGLLAQQVACLLTEQGDEVEYLMIIDSALHSIQAPKTFRRYHYLEQVFEKLMETLSNNAQAQLPNDFKDLCYTVQLDTFAERLLKAGIEGYSSKADLVLASKFFVDYVKAKRPLTPTAISGKTVLLKASENDEQALLLEGWARTILSDKRIVEVDGEHNTLLQGESFEQVIGVLRAGLGE
ncbi:MAG: AMP-binding protein, partial [Algicola sp.]|nr:AMP-binding protein [Algicola sp.]